MVSKPSSSHIGALARHNTLNTSIAPFPHVCDCAPALSRSSEPLIQAGDSTPDLIVTRVEPPIDGPVTWPVFDQLQKPL